MRNISDKREDSRYSRDDRQTSRHASYDRGSREDPYGRVEREDPYSRGERDDVRGGGQRRKPSRGNQGKYHTIGKNNYVMELMIMLLELVIQLFF